MGLAIPFAVFGQYAVTLTFTFMSGMMAKADKYAEEANVKGIRNINFLEMAVLGCLFGVLAVAGLYGGTALGETCKKESPHFSGHHNFHQDSKSNELHSAACCIQTCHYP